MAELFSDTQAIRCLKPHSAERRHAIDSKKFSKSDRRSPLPRLPRTPQRWQPLQRHQSGNGNGDRDDAFSDRTGNAWLTAHDTTPEAAIVIASSASYLLPPHHEVAPRALDMLGIVDRRP